MERVIHTRRLRLRPPQPGDEVQAHARWAHDPVVLRYLGWRPRASVEHTRQQLDWDAARWLKRSAWTWMLLRRDGALGVDGLRLEGAIGMVQLEPLRHDGPPHHLRLGYLLAGFHQGQGLMQEAVDAVTRQAFALPSVWRVDALCDVENLASARLLERAGFMREGCLARHALHPNVSDEPRDVWCYARVRAPAAGDD